MTGKQIGVVLADLSAKLDGTWAATLVAETRPDPPEHPADVPMLATNPPTVDGTDPGPPKPAWPLRLPLGKPSAADLTHRWPATQTWAIGWRNWATTQNLHLDWANRVTNGIRQSLPTHLTVPDIDTAAALVGHGWPERLHRARARLDDMQRRFPHAATPRMLTALNRLSDTDYTLLLIAADWFTRHDATGMTPRQVPIEGLHGKWLNDHHRLLATLCHKETLGLASRPTRIHFTYLDPSHLATGGRRHDSHTFGDTSRPAYQPRLVIISENKDTAVLFPDTPHAISIEGNGFAGPTLITQLDWVHAADHILYWGDIDADGYDIIHRYRANGLPVRTILMDPSTYETYERFGAWETGKNAPVPCRPAKTLHLLTDDEQAVYRCLTDPAWDRVRRIEQERIPLAAAAALVAETVNVSR